MTESKGGVVVLANGGATFSYPWISCRSHHQGPLSKELMIVVSDRFDNLTEEFRQYSTDRPQQA